MILNVNLRDSDQKRLTGNVETRVGKSQENIEAGWEAVKTFLQENFRQTWWEHTGLNHSDALGKDTSMPLKTAFVNWLKPKSSKALKIRYSMMNGTAMEHHLIRLLNGL
ncbi:hypothetical protein Q7C36_020740 [Tachysurus vachellii]|uniref:Uncharacterized protein n=1 Tax=Tachysurus vachellii TaxID=175792 RepID=A0AA88J3P8_TACVA|nr:hypothetical protein Q7C36_020740 [Tachysurus vachellii]